MSKKKDEDEKKIWVFSYILDYIHESFTLDRFVLAGVLTFSRHILMVTFATRDSDPKNYTDRPSSTLQ